MGSLGPRNLRPTVLKRALATARSACSVMLLTGEEYDILLSSVPLSLSSAACRDVDDSDVSWVRAPEDVWLLGSDGKPFR